MESGRPELYPARSRETNVTLIKNILNARSQEGHDQAQREFAAGLHPSLFAELDWMERVVPAERRDGAAKLADALFLNNLEGILAARRAEFDLDEDGLRTEVPGNRDFYRMILETAPEIGRSLGPELEARLRSAYAYGAAAPDAAGRGDAAATPPAPSGSGNADRSLEWARRLREQLDSVGDRRNVPLILNEYLANAMAETLDHVASRMRAKSFLRSAGGSLPHFRGGDAESPVEEWRSLLTAVADRAGEASLPSLQAVAAAASDYLDRVDLAALDRFEGEQAMGYGHCGNCAMMFASRAVVSLDPRCPFLFERGSDTLHLPLGFNQAVCPFCGARRRINAPSMFYRPSNGKIIYCLPTMGQFTEAQALDVHRDMISGLRDRYRASLDPEAAEVFDAAGEEFTYSMSRFIVAVQMGTTNTVWHAFNVVKLADGSALLVDKTMNTVIELFSASEVNELWEQGDVMAPESVVLSTDTATGPSADALSAFASGDAEGARRIAERQVAERPIAGKPGAFSIRQFLAKLFLGAGKKDLAAGMLEGDGNG